jgi:hypothetical protein
MSCDLAGTTGVYHTIVVSNNNNNNDNDNNNTVVTVRVGVYRYVLPTAFWFQHFEQAFDDSLQLERDGWLFGLLVRALQLPSSAEQLAFLASLSDYDLAGLQQEAGVYRLLPLQELIASTRHPPLAAGTEDHVTTFCTQLATATMRQPFLRRMTQLPATETAFRAWIQTDRRVRGFLSDILEGKAEYNQSSPGFCALGRWTHDAFPAAIQYLAGRMAGGSSSEASAAPSPSPPSPDTSALPPTNASPTQESQQAQQSPQSTASPTVGEAMGAALRAGARALDRLHELSSSWLANNAAAVSATASASATAPPASTAPASTTSGASSASASGRA